MKSTLAVCAVLATLSSFALSACGTEEDIGIDAVESEEEQALVYRCGDVNSSGAITVTDATMAYSYAARTATPTPTQKWLADINRDNVITNYDGDQIARKAAGLSAVLNCATFGPVGKIGSW